jgi:hypothetical protein
MNKRIVRLTKDEFETDDGSVCPINPPLTLYGRRGGRPKK